ncbi:MAG: hypothetical protein GY821_11010 [Gammaproteobacteria bacterium]|nr:hypothetical protein [Gammaproteobacteria bacterium]
MGQSYHLITPPEIAMAANTPTGFVYEHYVELVAQGLAQHGMVKAINSRPTYEVRINYVTGKPHTYTRSVPTVGQTGIMNQNTVYTYGGGSGTSNTYYTPSYGIVGYHHVHDTLFPYSFCLDFYQPMLANKRRDQQTEHSTIQHGNLVYQTCATTHIHYKPLETVYPALINALFLHFPADNASHYQVYNWSAWDNH